jgi:glycosyltransferase involved in cell wall biosynthesis
MRTASDSHKKKLVVIVQDRPTQFDSPLYVRLLKHAPFDLHVYYTQAVFGRTAVDPEVGHAPDWDHIRAGQEHMSWVKGAGVMSLAKRISESNPSLVIVSGYYPVLHACLALLLKLRAVRIGLRIDNTELHSRYVGVKGILKRVALPILVRFYDTWHPVGTLARQHLEKVASAKRPTFLFPYNVDNEWFASNSRMSLVERAALRKELGFAEDDFVVLGVMKWNDREDPLTLVSAFNQLLVTTPKARLLLVGDGPLRQKVRDALSHLLSFVHLPGYVSYSALPRLYGVSDVFVHTAPGESWGVSVNEAMACSLPVVTARSVGASVDLVSTGITGFTFADRDYSEPC